MSERTLSLVLQRTIKAMADRVLAAIVLVACVPVLGVIAIALYRWMGRPIFFTQLRPGKDARLFTI